MFTTKLQEYLPSQQERISKKLEKRLISIAIVAIENCNIKNLTLTEFQDLICNSFVGMPKIPELKFSDFTINLLQEIGTEKLYEIYKNLNVDEKSKNIVPQITQNRNKAQGDEIKSKQEFLITQEAVLILNILRALDQKDYSNDNFWRVINKMTKQNKHVRTSIANAVKLAMTTTELVQFGLSKSSNQNLGLEIFNEDIQSLAIPFTKPRKIKREKIHHQDFMIFSNEISKWLVHNNEGFKNLDRNMFAEPNIKLSDKEVHMIQKKALKEIYSKFTPFIFKTENSTLRDQSEIWYTFIVLSIVYWYFGKSSILNTFMDISSNLTTDVAKLLAEIKLNIKPRESISHHSL